MGQNVDAKAVQLEPLWTRVLFSLPSFGKRKASFKQTFF